MIKILITGTTTAGKTTLLDALAAKKIRDVVILPEIARTLLDKNPELERDPNFQDILFSAQLEQEVRAVESGAPVVVCDRGVLDIIAHARLFGQAVKSEWQAWASSGYDRALWLRKDDIRYEPTELQQKIATRDWAKFRDDLDREIEHVLGESGLPWQQLSGTPEQRVFQLEKLIRGHAFSIEGNLPRNKERK